jgi:hypothetical protein
MQPIASFIGESWSETPSLICMLGKACTTVRDDLPRLVPLDIDVDAHEATVRAGNDADVGVGVAGPISHHLLPRESTSL